MSNNLKAGEFYGQVTNKRTVSALILTEVVHKQPIRVPQHSHELGYFQLFLGGNYLEHCGGKSIESSPMTISWHRPGVIHKGKIGRNGGRFFMIELQSPLIDKIRQFSSLAEDFQVRNSPLIWLGCWLYHEFKNWQFCSDLIAEGIILEMFAYSARQKTATEKRPPKWLNRIVEKLNQDFTENLSTEELALEANVHPVHLATTFRQFHHETIGKYVQKLRITRASQMLLNNEMSLTEIAVTTGFSDQSHFTRTFKHYLGIPPGAFRCSLNCPTK